MEPSDYALYSEAGIGGDTDALKALIEHGVDVNRANEYGCTALMIAAFYGRDDVIKTLLDNGADVNRVDRDGNTALMLAIREGKTDAIKILLEHGANTDRLEEKKAQQDGATKAAAEAASRRTRSTFAP